MWDIHMKTIKEDRYSLIFEYNPRDRYDILDNCRIHHYSSCFTPYPEASIYCNACIKPSPKKMSHISFLCLNYRGQNMCERGTGRARELWRLMCFLWKAHPALPRLFVCLRINVALTRSHEFSPSFSPKWKAAVKKWLELKNIKGGCLTIALHANCFISGPQSFFSLQGKRNWGWFWEDTWTERKGLSSHSLKAIFHLRKKESSWEDCMWHMSLCHILFGPFHRFCMLGKVLMEKVFGAKLECLWEINYTIFLSI